MVGNDEIAVLNESSSRKEFRCDPKHWKPSLGFDLRYHAGWQAELHARDLPRQAARFRVVLRVTPLGAEAVHITDSLGSPPREKAHGGRVSLWGNFVLGPGKYKVDWLLRDPQNRFCSSHWNVTVKHDDDVRIAIDPGVVALPWTVAPRQPGNEPAGRRFNVKILANFSNTRPGRAVLDRRYASAVGAILRTIAREPRFARFSLVAFNMQEERVIHESKDSTRIDFRALSEAMSTMRLGVVDINRLADKNSATRFLTTLLTTHLAPAGGARPDAVLIVGPKLFLDRDVPKEAMQAIEGAGAPVFYLNYVPYIRSMPWRDSVGHAVKQYGGDEYRITTPKELGEAMTEIFGSLDRASTAKR